MAAEKSGQFEGIGTGAGIAGDVVYSIARAETRWIMDRPAAWRADPPFHQYVNGELIDQDVHPNTWTWPRIASTLFLRVVTEQSGPGLLPVG